MHLTQKRRPLFVYTYFINHLSFVIKDLSPVLYNYEINKATKRRVLYEKNSIFKNYITHIALLGYYIVLGYPHGLS